MIDWDVVMDIEGDMNLVIILYLDLCDPFGIV
jgi:hypothetical protein